MWPKSATARPQKFRPRQGANPTLLVGKPVYAAWEIARASQLGFGHLQDAEKPAPFAKKREECGTRKFKVKGCAAHPNLMSTFYNLQGRFILLP